MGRIFVFGEHFPGADPHQFRLVTAVMHQPLFKFIRNGRHISRAFLSKEVEELAVRELKTWDDYVDIYILCDHNQLGT